MDRKSEIKKDLWNILKDVYVLNEEKGVTTKQNEFLDRVVEYLDINLSLRRKQIKEKPPEKEEDEFPLSKNPDRARFDL